ncbi:MAG: hypothetical protein WCI75_14695 [candidate division NC10 bacterium]
MELSTVTVRVAAATGTANYAGAILPNHCHLLLRSGPIGLPVFMRRWLTGYAITFGPPVRVPGITPDELAAGSRRGPIPVLRAIIAKERVTRLGLSVAEAARRLGVTTSAISRAIRRPGPE